MGGALSGMFLRRFLPDHHLGADAKDVVRLGSGLIGTIAALVLGLLIASAKSSFDTQSSQVKQMAASIILLDQHLALYGPDANTPRQLMRNEIGALADRIWQQGRAPKAEPFEFGSGAMAIYVALEKLEPKTEAQRLLQARSIQIITDLAQTRLLLFEQAITPIPMPFLVVLIFWLVIIFASFSLFSEPTPFVIGALLLFALSAAGAIFLILEMSQPFTGMMQIPRATLSNALPPLSP